MPGHEPIHTLPDAHLASFNTADQLYLRAEWSALYARVSPTTGFVHSGGLHAAVAGMVSAPFAVEAFTELGHRITADGAGGTVAINYTTMSATANDTAWVIATAATPDIAGNFHRVGSSNLMVNVIDTTQPMLPANSVWLMKVTITSSGIAAVQDLRVPSSWARHRVFDITDPLYGAVGDGLTDCSAAIQAAMRAAVFIQAEVRVPRAQVHYLVNTPINLTNLPLGLTVVGDGLQAPTYGTALVPMSGGSVFAGNTGTGNAVFDCAGSSNLLFRQVGIVALGQPTPSTVGFLFGTSTTAVALQAPGGANCSLENVAIQLANANTSCPVYFTGGAGLSHFYNVWTLGVYGISLSANNDLALTSSYVTLGPVIGVAGVIGIGCNLLGYGGAPPLALEVAHNQRWSQTYVATIFGGPGYAGQAYAVFVKDCIDVKLDLEIDYFPTALLLDGTCSNCHFYGSTFPHLTPLGVGQALIAFLAGEVVSFCTFNIFPLLDASVIPANNYHYTTNGITASMDLVISSTFLWRPAMSTFVAFFNMTAAVGTPFFNLHFHGDGTAGSFDFEINGVNAAENTKRYFINGILFGSA